MGAALILSILSTQVRILDRWCSREQKPFESKAHSGFARKRLPFEAGWRSVLPCAFDPVPTGALVGFS